MQPSPPQHNSPRNAPAPPASRPRLADVIAPMSYALDIVEGQPEGHAIRACMIAMRIAEELDLHDDERLALFYALLLKDAGGSATSARTCAVFGADDRTVKRDLRMTNWQRRGPMLRLVARHIDPDSKGRLKRVARLALGVGDTLHELAKARAERGAEITRGLHLPAPTSEAIRAIDEHWNGAGLPRGLSKHDIPLLARIACLAQTAEVFAQNAGPDGAFRVATERSGTWFDPDVVKAFLATRSDTAFWARLHDPMVRQHVAGFEPPSLAITADQDAVDRVAYAFAMIIDAKSPWTVRHSLGVSEVAVAIASFMGLDPGEIRRLRRAALLHDIGKLGVSNRILDKPGKLTRSEREEVKLHPAYSLRILERVEAFADLAELAGSHHERLDGHGYFRGLTADDLDTSARILVVADMYEALAATRPYRPEMTERDVITILKKYSGTAICPEVFGALRTLFARGSVQVTPRNAAA